METASDPHWLRLSCAADTSGGGAAAVRPVGSLARVLLETDGTVTYILEAWAGERIEAVKLHQERGASDTGEATSLDLSPGAPVLRRRALLRGAETGRCLLYASALVATDRIDRRLADALTTTSIPIGRLLAQSRTETFREILRTGSETAGALGRHFGLFPSAELLCRAYRILNGGRPIMLITERFPPHLFLEAADERRRARIVETPGD